MPPKGSRRKGLATNTASAVVEDAVQNGAESNFVANDIVEKPQSKLRGRPKKETKAGVLANGSLTDNSDLNGHGGDEPENEVASHDPITEEKPLDKKGRPKKVAKSDIKIVEESSPVNPEENVPETIDEEVEKDEPGAVPKKKGGRIAKNTGRGRKKTPNEEQHTDVPEETEDDNSAKIQKPASTRGRKPAAAVTEVKPKNQKAKKDNTVQEPGIEEAKGSRGRKRKNPVAIEEEQLKLKPEELEKAKNVQVSLLRQDKIDKMALDLKSLDDTKVKVAAGKGRGRKRAAEEEGSTSASASKRGKGKASQPAKKEKIPDVDALDFKNESINSEGDSWNLKIASWNVNGLRAWIEKNGMSYLTHEDPDILCVQETKCSEDKIPEESNPLGYHCYWLSGDKDGYSGVGLMSKIKPKSVEYGIRKKVHDNEGRVITAEYENYYVVATYVPNAGRKLVRLDYRQQWDVDFRAYLQKLDKTKPVILCGDLNVAHKEIDLANPKTNKKNAGFTQEERDGFSTLLSEGFIDSFRHLYPDTKDAYTFWTYMAGARAKNVGWRLDYFVISERLATNLCDCVIRKDVMGSDHCPLVLFLHI